MTPQVWIEGVVGPNQTSPYTTNPVAIGIHFFFLGQMRFNVGFVSGFAEGSRFDMAVNGYFMGNSWLSGSFVFNNIGIHVFGTATAAYIQGNMFSVMCLWNYAYGILADSNTAGAYAWNVWDGVCYGNVQKQYWNNNTNLVTGNSVRFGANPSDSAARLSNAQGEDTLTVAIQDVLNIDLLIVAHERVPSPSAGFVLFDRLGNLVFSASTGNLHHRLPVLEPGESLVVRLTVRFSVQPGRYIFNVGTAELGRVHDWHEMLGPIEVFHEGEGPLPFHGIAELPMECRHGVVEPAVEERATSGATSRARSAQT